MSLLRLLKILKLAREYRIKDCFTLDEPNQITHDRGIRLRKYLTELGPVFIKLGQVLSIRGDILPSDVIIELEKLQDSVPPFDGHLAKKTVENSFKKPISEIFQSFDLNPIASASVAQIHSAILHNGRKVAVKIIRPGIKATIKQEISWMKIIGRIVHYLHPGRQRLHFLDVVKEFETSILNEIDLNYEAANAGQFRRQFMHDDLLYIPEVFWDLVSKDVMVIEFIEGTNIGDLEKLIEQNIDLPQLAQSGIKIFFKQVLDFSFFHADLHPGNLFVDTTLSEHPKFIAVDFGIIGMLNQTDRHYIAYNFIAFFNQDYRRIAELHIESGWVPQDTRVDEFESSIRTVCEPLFSRPLGQISLAKLMLNLFQVAQKFETEIQPQLLMLQKTLFTVEALGRKLDPNLNLWDTAKPELEAWAKRNSNWTSWITQTLQSPPIWLEGLQTQPSVDTKDTVTLKIPPALFTLGSLVIMLTLTNLSPALLTSIHFLVLLTQMKK